MKYESDKKVPRKTIKARDLDAAYRINFSTGWTHSSNGMTPNGTSAYAISVNQGSGLPPFQNSKTDTSTTNCGLDPETGFLYGYIPDQGTTEIEYSFNITVYQTAGVSPPILCTATAAGTNRITCTSTASLAVPSDWYSPGDLPLYVPIKLSGTGLGGLSTVGETLYYVLYVYSDTEFSVTASATSKLEWSPSGVLLNLFGLLGFVGRKVL